MPAQQYNKLSFLQRHFYFELFFRLNLRIGFLHQAHIKHIHPPALLEK